MTKINHFDVYFLSTAETQVRKTPPPPPGPPPLCSAPTGPPSMRCTDAPTLCAKLKIVAVCMCGLLKGHKAHGHRAHEHHGGQVLFTPAAAAWLMLGLVARGQKRSAGLRVKLKRLKKKRKINGKGTTLRFFCRYGLTGQKCNTFKWSFKWFFTMWPSMTFDVWRSGDQQNYEKQWVTFLAGDLSAALSSEDSIIDTFSRRGFWLLENSEPVYSTG